MTNYNIKSADFGVLTEQLPYAVGVRVELGINQDRTLLEKSKVRSKDRLFFCH